MLVRAARLADYEAIRALWHASDAYHAQQAPAVARLPAEPRFRHAELAELLANTRYCRVLVAEHGTNVVGFVEASIRDPERPDEATTPWCGINNLAVDEGWRRRGVATQLLTAVEDWARQQGIKHVRLDVFEFNTGARASYLSSWPHVARRTARSVVT